MTTLAVPWLPRTGDENSGISVLADGRLHVGLDHPPLRAVTPARLHQWFAQPRAGAHDAGGMSIGAGVPLHGRGWRGTVLRLDDTGYMLRLTRFGVPLALLNHRWRMTTEGTQWRQSLTLGLAGRWTRPLNALLRHALFPTAALHAWMQASVALARRLDHAGP